MNRQEKIIWAAGFLDGEGCISIIRDRNNFQCLVDAAQVNKPPLEVLRELFGGLLRFAESPRGGHWQWRVYARRASDACKELLPYLVNKQEQARMLITFQETKGDNGAFVSPETYAFRAQLYLAVKKLNPRRPLNAERLSEEAPRSAGDAIVRSHANDKHENTAEMTVSSL